MECPKCGREAIGEPCACGHVFSEDKPAPKRKKKTKRRRPKRPRVDLHGLQAQHSMGVLLLILLTTITCGFYGAFWYNMRLPFVNALDTSTKLEPGTAKLLIVLSAANLGVMLLAIMTMSDVDLGSLFDIISRLLGLGAGILNLVLAFRVRRALIDYGKRYTPGYDVSGLATFFFNVYYLQYKINHMQFRAPIDDIVNEFA